MSKARKKALDEIKKQMQSENIPINRETIINYIVTNIYKSNDKRTKAVE